MKFPAILVCYCSARALAIREKNGHIKHPPPTLTEQALVVALITMQWQVCSQYTVAKGEI